MTETGSRALAWSLFVLTVAAVVTSGVLLVLGLDAPDPEGSFGFRGFSSLYAVVFAVVGLLIALRRPENPIGWMMLVSGGLLGAVQQVAQLWATWTVLGDGTLPGGEVAAWFQDWAWLPQFAALGSSLLLIPDGHMQSRGWRPVAWALVTSTTLALVARVLMPGPIESFRQVENPFGVDGARDLLEAGYAIAITVALIALVAAAVSLAIRRSRARGEERAQIRWVTFGGLIVSITFLVYGVVFGILNTGPAVDVMEVVFVLAVMVFGATFGIAILRNRLFDIDVVVSRTVVFGLLAVFITVVYVGVVVGIGALVGQGGDTVLSAAAAALVAIAFQPVRRRAQRVANRVAFGERASPYEVLSEFSQRVAGAYSSDDVLLRMARILNEGTGAARAEVWLRAGRRLELSAAWPDGDGRPDPVPLDGDGLPALADVSCAVPVLHEGGLLGALTVTKPPSEPISATEERLVEDLAHQAGLVLRNAALIADLRASRQRLVAAQDEERRRLERNLHDGAQQQLVALSVKLGLLKRVAGELPAQADALVDQLQAESQDALETLRDLARGIFPPLLADRGLGAALEAQARKAPMPVGVVAEGIRRYPPAVEAAVYFCCLEALQNVAKYAEASRVTVRIAEVGALLSFEVADDGVGFDAEATTAGTGLQGIRDRLSALDGTLDVRSAPGEGTTLAGHIPLRS